MKQPFERVLREICFMVKVEGRKVLRDFGITPAQFDILQKIYFEGPKRPGELSLLLGVAKSTISGLVKRLETDGYLTRRPDAADGRAYLLAITRKGESVIEKVIERRESFIEKITSELGQEKAENILKILKELKDIMEKNFSKQ
ncbi:MULTISPECIES: MarR family winged helix-turn-helix transcriptional regulator [Thermotoga]|uniref:Transcriptional regulator, MarR family n=1 Tax=Thermotoga neapolitana (strain ATCC 49049 / DSM 4359 / NBRC 107923 / NS-E) TaxID=309803 RepID=B9KAR8_THENN|nr:MULTISPECIES: MarR family transcriptional regulator [Thermotoga]ACM24051.1 Transcriptional regulator, MarR family [Thermotoga neapolitana DSM 4359]AJG40073.1 MarR family transcriptional regulator [Thermotoga sp. RQ7]KFZ20843.1 Transcriptional regulator, MarR family protein [Thermotoga neapolitana LA10]HBF10903.1 MarR family transcriptional regulator [Thermotoga neapolitana]